MFERLCWRVSAVRRANINPTNSIDVTKEMFARGADAT
jgi:hypothetical protein